MWDISCRSPGKCKGKMSDTSGLKLQGQERTCALGTCTLTLQYPYGHSVDVLEGAIHGLQVSTEPTSSKIGRCTTCRGCSHEKNFELGSETAATLLTSSEGCPSLHINTFYRKSFILPVTLFAAVTFVGRHPISFHSMQRYAQDTVVDPYACRPISKPRERL